MLVYAQSATTFSSLAPALSCGRAIRESRNTAAASSASPLSTTSWTAGATRSMKVSAPASAESKRTVVTDR
ncbi:hypothetical protein SCYAM73S_06203 [Streptomyces cyaneofuscatus]